MASVASKDGKMLIMKRSSNTQRYEADDGLRKECSMARYLNLVSARKGIANCVGERTFEPHEVAALKASQMKISREWSEKSTHNHDRWLKRSRTGGKLREE